MRALFLFLFPCLSIANPYWQPELVPQDSAYKILKHGPYATLQTPTPLKKALRVSVKWDEKTERYSLDQTIIENSGTESLELRSRKDSPWGSYKAKFYSTNTEQAPYYDSIGTGKEYRKLVDTITFRIPLPTADIYFEMTAENPQTGKMELVLRQKITLSKVQEESYQRSDLSVNILKKADLTPAVQVVIYAEAYTENRREVFFQDAQKTVDALVSTRFPGVEHMEFSAVFAPSQKKLDMPQNLGLPVAQRDSFLGLYYPYWDDFGRWTDVIYPTNENYFRKNLALVAYDYPIVLVDSNSYWGIGNYKVMTAVPAHRNDFVYLLTHEMGHFFGLNEEYEGGGRTELEFAPEIPEAWSQNMTFLPNPTDLTSLKWTQFVIDPQTPIPTPDYFWTPNKYGAYVGGYADSYHAASANHKPGFACVMDRGKDFCPICTKGILDVIQHDIGQ